MAYTIMIGNQKGGVSKTVTSGVTAWMLQAGYSVLAVDLDPQGSLTEMFTGKPIREYRLEGYEGILYAMQKEDPRDHVLPLTESLDIIPSDEDLGSISRHIWGNRIPEPTKVLQRTLSLIQADYDFIIIDTPPNLGDLMTNAMTASDGVVAMFDCSSFTYSALFSFFETLLEVVKQSGASVQPLGVLCSLIDSKRSDMKEHLEIIREHPYLGPLVFNTVLKRSAYTGRLSYAGFKDNPELAKATAQYKPYIKELLERVKRHIEERQRGRA